MQWQGVIITALLEQVKCSRVNNKQLGGQITTLILHPHNLAFLRVCMLDTTFILVEYQLLLILGVKAHSLNFLLLPAY